MKSVLIIFLLVFTFKTNAQSCKFINHTFLQACINNEKFDLYFRLKETDLLILMDSNNYFSNYNHLTLSNRQIVLKKEISYHVEKKNEAKKEEIVIYKVDCIKNTYYIYFWQPLTNSTLIFLVKPKYKHIQVKIIGEGVF